MDIIYTYYSVLLEKVEGVRAWALDPDNLAVLSTSTLGSVETHSLVIREFRGYEGRAEAFSREFGIAASPAPR